MAPPSGNEHMFTDAGCHRNKPLSVRCGMGTGWISNTVSGGRMKLVPVVPVARAGDKRRR